MQKQNLVFQQKKCNVKLEFIEFTILLSINEILPKFVCKPK